MNKKEKKVAVIGHVDHSKVVLTTAITASLVSVDSSTFVDTDIYTEIASDIARLPYKQRDITSPIRTDPKIGRNEPCPCGKTTKKLNRFGRKYEKPIKYKKCCINKPIKNE